MVQHHTKGKGDSGLGFVLADLMKHGIHVALPLSEHLPFDCIGVHPDGRMLRIQVKYRASDGERIRIELSSTWSDANGLHRKKRRNGSYDVLAVYCPNTQSCYYIREGDLPDVDLILRLKPAKNGQTKGVRMADDFIDPLSPWSNG
jgi:hypothetical protein